MYTYMFQGSSLPPPRDVGFPLSPPAGCGPRDALIHDMVTRNPCTTRFQSQQGGVHRRSSSHA